MKSVLALLLAAVLLAALVIFSPRPQVRPLEDPAAFTIFLPAVAHDCTPFICGTVSRLQALTACQEEMVRLRNTEHRTQLPTDCAEFRLPSDPDFIESPFREN
jgi:hypothetical protein